jgi:hypothetical protein
MPPAANSTLGDRLQALVKVTTHHLAKRLFLPFISRYRRIHRQPGYQQKKKRSMLAVIGSLSLSLFLSLAGSGNRLI